MAIRRAKAGGRARKQKASAIRQPVRGKKKSSAGRTHGRKVKAAAESARPRRRSTGKRPARPQASVGVIGGSGLYDLAELADVKSVSVSTPFGRPSDRLTIGRLGDVSVAFLPRHGRGHRVSPTELNFRANIFALKSLGVQSVIAVSAVGSLREDVAPGDLVIPDQFIDWTRGRVSTFFRDGIVAHVAFADPVCPRLSAALVTAGEAVGATVHGGGTYLCIEGPQFSTRAESELYRSWGAHVIGMTNLQEAKLAREAEMCFATIAMVTDYDCWNPAASDVDVREIIRVLNENVRVAKKLVALVARGRVEERACACANALQDAIITDRAHVSSGVRRRLDLLLRKYLG